MSRFLFIGAHPDDPDICFGATALKMVRKGHVVKFVAACNGDAGHYNMTHEALASRRYNESRAVMKYIGLDDYEVFQTHDCAVQSDLASRERVIRVIRNFKPDVVISHWLYDYHPDHRATAQLVQDSAYLLRVPLCCEDTPVPEVNPIFAYAFHQFTDPRPMRVDAAVEFDSVFDEKCRILDQHRSQFYEWLPWSEGIVDFKLDNLDWDGRKAHLARWLARFTRAADMGRNALMKSMGAAGASVKYAEVFEQTPYGRQVSTEDFQRLFNGENVDGSVSIGGFV